MELIKPGEEPKQENGDLKQRAIDGVGPQEEKQTSPLSAHFGDDGVVTMRLDLKAAIANEDIFHMLRGLMDNTRDKALAHIHGVRAQMAKDRDEIIRMQNKGTHRGFLNKILKH